MGMLLRILVVITLVLGCGAWYLTYELAGKREALVNRTHLLEQQFRSIAKTIENADPADAQASFAAKDISPVDKDVDTPERSTFWSSYQLKLEQPNLKALDLESDASILQLRKYYQTDSKGEKIKDPINPGSFVTKGPGTMQQLLDQVQDRATKQNAALNKTRVELQRVREELVTTIEDYNKIKLDARANRKAVDEKAKEVEKAKEDVRAAQKKASNLEDEKKTFSGDLADAKAETEKAKTAVDALEKQLKSKEEVIKKLNDEIKKKPQGATVSTTPTVEVFAGTPGDKGKVVAVDETLKFVVIEVSDAAITELIGEQRDRALPQVDLLVRRAGLKSAAGEFVTRIKLRQIIRQKNLIVADILTDWQQAPVEINDVVFF